jgi:hypothetical protein
MLTMILLPFIYMLGLLTATVDDTNHMHMASLTRFGTVATYNSGFRRQGTGLRAVDHKTLSGPCNWPVTRANLYTQVAYAFLTIISMRS